MRSFLRMKVSGTVLATAVAVSAATWNDMSPKSNTEQTDFWDTTGHAYVENNPGAAFPVTGTLVGGAVTVLSGGVSSFDGRVSFEAVSGCARILESTGLIFIFK